jgi:hypothetical protein
MPIGLDRRTHQDADIEQLTPAVFFGDRFPRLAETNGHLLAQAVDQLGTRPLSIEVDDGAWTIIVDDRTVRAVPDLVDGAVVVTLAPAEFSDWCQNLRSLNSFSVARTLRSRGGDERDVSIWDSLLLSLLYGWPTVGEVDFLDRHGGPLDLDRHFTPDDEPADVAHFLREAGFLHLRGWVEPELMPVISADMDRMLPTYAEGDGKSWWAQLEDGRRVCVRLQDFVDHSSATASMLSSPRWDLLRRTVAAGEPLMQAPVEGRCIEALIKPVGVVSGPSDLSFHRDCHLGRHAYTCSGTVIGISLTASHPANGQLRVIPGSHRVAMPVEVARTEPFLAPHPLSTQPGDLTVHLSCTLHASTPPRVEERRVMYTGFGLAGRGDGRSNGGEDLAALREQVTNLLREQETDLPTAAPKQERDR